MKIQFVEILYLIIIIKKSHTESDDDSDNDLDDFTGQNTHTVQLIQLRMSSMMT